MKIILFGAPGAGKGTQAEMLAKKYKVPHISTGDIFRENIAKKTRLGVEAKQFMDRGELVPDDITIGMLKDRIRGSDTKKGFILDGFPRTVRQAQALGKITEIDAVINLTTSEDTIVTRLSGRRTCIKCGAVYHTKFNPPKKEGFCNKCGSKLTFRADDSEKTVQRRFGVYEKQTQPLVKYYLEKNLLKDVNGEQPIGKIFNDILTVLIGIH